MAIGPDLKYCRQISRRSFIAACALASGIGRHVSAAPAKSPVKAAIDTALDELRKEFYAHQKDPKQPLRTSADYFTDKPVAGLTPELVFQSLDQRLDTDARVASYLRWQLLSALPKQLEPADAPRGIELYRLAPRPSPRYGLSEKDQQALDQLLPASRKTDDVILTSRLEAIVKVGTEQNRPFIAYRDEWYRRLPKTAPTFVAAFEDCFERQNLAAGAEEFAPIVIADAQNWLVVGKVDAAACSALAGLLAKLRDKPAPSYYASAAIRSGKLTWVKKTDSMDPRKKLTHLHQALIEAAQKLAAK